MVLDRRGSEPLVLTGRRAGGHVFMANKLVFPGGRIDRGDLRLARHFELAPAVTERLTAGVGARFGGRHACALALAAIRETFEETGIMIGHRASGFRSSLPAWKAFAAESVVPDPGCLTPFARAVTPPHQIRRYDTRFFAVDAAAIARAVPFDERPTDEFDRVAWMSLAEMAAEELAPITRVVLGELSRRLADGSIFSASQTMPCFRRGRDGFGRTLL